MKLHFDVISLVAVVGLESTVYTVSEDVGTVKVCALASSLNTSCPVAFSFNVRLSTRDQSAGITILTA